MVNCPLIIQLILFVLDGTTEPISSNVWSLAGPGNALQPGAHTFLGLYVPQFNPSGIGLINSDGQSTSHALCERASR